MSVIKSAAILVAAGQGERLINFTGGKPKQFIELNQVPLFIWSLATLANYSAIKQIVITVPEGWQERASELIKDFLPQTTKKIIIIAGGKTRQESVYRALEKIANEENQPSHVLIHDAARPFLTTTIIDSILLSLEKHDVVTTAIPLVDSIKEVANDNVVEDLDRKKFMLVQTPQAAKLSLWLESHRHANLHQKESTDDASIAKAYGAAVFVVAGNKLNFKITDYEDLSLAQAIVKYHDWSVGKIEIFAYGEQGMS